jgi:hypothetical protein
VTAEAEGGIPTRSELLANAVRAIAELHRQIDHQSDDSDGIDTKSQAIFAFVAAGATIVGSRTHISTPPQVVAGLVLVLLVLTAAFCALEVIRPRDEFSYGVDPSAVGRVLTTTREAELALGIAGALVESRDMNVEFLRMKQRWLKRQFVFLEVAAVSAVAFGLTGAMT